MCKLDLSPVIVETVVHSGNRQPKSKHFLNWIIRENLSDVTGL